MFYTILVNGLKQFPSHIETWKIDELYEFYEHRPIYLIQEAYDNWISGVRDEFDPEKIMCEIKWCKYHKVVDYLQSRDDCVGVKKEEQKEIIQKHNGSQCYLSYQILSSLDLGCRYVAIAGSASLLCMALPVNVIFASDHLSNVTEHMYYFKSLVNSSRYKWSTVGFMHHRSIHYDNEDMDWLLDTDWRMGAMKHCLDNAPIVPGTLNVQQSPIKS